MYGIAGFVFAASIAIYYGYGKTIGSNRWRCSS